MFRGMLNSLPQSCDAARSPRPIPAGSSHRRRVVQRARVGKNGQLNQSPSAAFIVIEKRPAPAQAVLVKEGPDHLQIGPTGG